jgi:hypothetical protein
LKEFLVLILVLGFAVPFHPLEASLLAAHDPCDGYGDCISSSVSFVSSNPDHTLYLGDSFEVSVSVTRGPNTTGYSLSWSYDQSEFKKTGNTFTVSGSAIGAYSVTASATFSGSLAVGNTTQPFNSTLTTSQAVAVVRYDPEFTAYAYMLYGNSTASSSLERPWVLLVRYDGNLPGYSYAGDGNTPPFNGSRTLAERAYFGSFHFSTLSYKPFTTDGGVLEFRSTNSTGTAQYNWVNQGDSAPLYYGNRIEKYTFQATSSSLSSLLARGFIYQNVTMVGCWQQENACDLRRAYWLVPFLWSGRLNIVSVGSNGKPTPNTPISLTIQNPSPLDEWLTGNFVRVFGNDPAALRAFQEDLYPTNHSMTLSGMGRLSLTLNQTSLVPPQISIAAGGATLAGSFDFTPTFVNSAIMSVPNSLNGTVFYANATIPLWSYNVVQGYLAYLPVSTSVEFPSSFLELLSSSGWIAGNTTSPQTPAAFASQEFGFWPMGENLTLYVNGEGGGVESLGTKALSGGEYRASFFIEPWSGGIASMQVIQGKTVLLSQSTLTAEAYPSPLPGALTGPYSVTYPASGADTKIVFTNIWGATTTVDLGTQSPGIPPFDLIPPVTAAAFGVAFIAWMIVSGVLKTRRTNLHQ